MVEGVLYFIALLLSCSTDIDVSRSRFKVYFYFTKSEMVREFDRYSQEDIELQYNYMTCQVIDIFKGRRLDIVNGLNTPNKRKGPTNVFLPQLPLRSLPSGTRREKSILDYSSIGRGW